MRHIMKIIVAAVCLWAGQAGAESATTRPVSAPADETLAITLVTLHIKNAAPRQVIDDLAKQAGIKIKVWPDWAWNQIKGTVTLDADRQPFWPVMLQVCKQTRLRVGGPPGADITLMQDSGKEADRPYKSQGQFVVIAKDASWSHGVDYGNPADINTSFNINFDILVDPALHVLSGSSVLHVLSVQDDKGHSLAEPNQAADFFRPAPFRQNWLWNNSLSLKYRPDMGKTMSIKALALFQVVKRTDQWEILNIDKARNLSRIFPGGTYLVRGLRKTGSNSYTLLFTVNYDPSQFDGSTNGNPLTGFQSISDSITLLDAQGRALNSGGGGGGGDGMGKLTYTLSFRAGTSQGVTTGPPTKLIWKIPAEIKQIVVPVEFDNLVIP